MKAAALRVSSAKKNYEILKSKSDLADICAIPHKGDVRPRADCVSQAEGLRARSQMKQLESLALKDLAAYPYLSAGHDPTKDILENLPTIEALSVAKNSDDEHKALVTASSRLYASTGKTLDKFCDDPKSGDWKDLVDLPYVSDRVTERFPEFKPVHDCALTLKRESTRSSESKETFVSGISTAGCVLASLGPQALLVGSACSAMMLGKAGVDYHYAKSELEWTFACTQANADPARAAEVCGLDKYHAASAKYDDAVTSLYTEAAVGALTVGVAKVGGGTKLLREGQSVEEAGETLLLKSATSADSNFVPKGKYWEAIGPGQADEFGGKIFSYRRLVAESASMPLESDLTPFIKKYPKTANRLGMNLIEGGHTAPDVASLNNRIVKLNKELGRGKKIAVSFWEHTGEGEASMLDYLKNWSNRKLPINKDGTHRFHDLNVHGIVAFALPEEVVASSSSYADVFAKALENKTFTENPKLREYINYWTKRFIEEIDERTSNVAHIFVKEGRNLSEANAENLGGYLERISGHDGMRSFSENLKLVLKGEDASGWTSLTSLSPAERTEIQKLIRQIAGLQKSAMSEKSLVEAYLRHLPIDAN
jgi:hypothetical protein